ncbi:MAG: beta-propeller fold lactonase family protein [Terracidiphilus sp.]|jgi:6-phosphogluconolactonase (cycloisomerase 2 family)
MKFSKLSQLILVSSIGLLVASLLTACSLTTIDFVYVASSSGINSFAVDGQSGALRTARAAVTAGIDTPVAMALSADYGNLYVANKGNNTIVHFAIDLKGGLTAQSDTISVNAPVALAVNTAGTYLYVVSGTNSATLSEYPLTSGAIGGTATSTQTLSLSGISSAYTDDILVPTGINVLANNGSDIKGNAVYVTAYDQSSYVPGGSPTCTANCANPGWVFGYSIGSGGALTVATGSPWKAGVLPSAIVSDPTDRFVYVTDYASDDLVGYTIVDAGTLNTLAYMANSPFGTGRGPTAVTIDPRGIFIYITDSLDNRIMPYEITVQTGVPTSASNLVSGSSDTTEALPVAVAVEPALGRYVYTANYDADTLSGFRLDPTSGTLYTTQSTPYPTGAQPTALVIIPHGNHALQTVTP